jgi:hypothetical protein
VGRDEIYLGRASMKTPMSVWSVIDHVKGKRSDLVVDHGSLGVVLAALTFAGLYGRQVSIDYQLSASVTLTGEAWYSPPSRILVMQASSLSVPNSFCSMLLLAVSRTPWAPWLNERLAIEQ